MNKIEQYKLSSPKHINKMKATDQSSEFTLLRSFINKAHKSQPKDSDSHIHKGILKMEDLLI